MAWSPAIKSAFWDHWETAVLGQILARSPLEPEFGTLVAWNPAIKSPFWDHWETAVLGQILAGRLLEPAFGTLVACKPAIKRAFWDYWETAVLGQILAGSVFGAAVKGSKLVGKAPRASWLFGAGKSVRHAASE